MCAATFFAIEIGREKTALLAISEEADGRWSHDGVGIKALCVREIMKRRQFTGEPRSSEDLPVVVDPRDRIAPILSVYRSVPQPERENPDRTCIAIVRPVSGCWRGSSRTTYSEICYGISRKLTANQCAARKQFHELQMAGSRAKAGQRRIPIGDEIRSLVELLPLPIETNEK